MLNWFQKLMGEEPPKKRSLLEEEHGRNLDVELENKQKTEAAQLMAKMAKDRRDFAAFPELVGLVGNQGFVEKLRSLGEIIKEHEFKLISSSAEPDLLEAHRTERQIVISLHALNMIVPPTAQSKSELTDTLRLYLQAASAVSGGKALNSFEVTTSIYAVAVDEVVSEAALSPSPSTSPKPKDR